MAFSTGDNSNGVFGSGYGAGSTGVYGYTTGGTGVFGNSDSGEGVHGIGDTGVYGFGFTYGVQGVDNGGSGTAGVRGEGNNIGVWGYCTGGGVGLYASQNSGFAAAKFDGDLIIAPNPAGTGNTPSTGNLYVKGQGHANGGFFTGRADLAEFIPVLEKLEAGDVVEIDPNNMGHFRRCATAGSLAVAGVISTRPGVSLGAYNPADGVNLPANSGPRLALAGRIPVKVTDEGGQIRLGDLLIASSTPGHAMRAPTPAIEGSVVGKALGLLNSGIGTIEMLVMLR